MSAYGSAPAYGTAAAASPVVGLARTPSGRGYWLVTREGDVLTREGSGATGSYAFLAKTSSGQPMRYDPCQPVRFVINPAGAPSGAVSEVREDDLADLADAGWVLEQFDEVLCGQAAGEGFSGRRQGRPASN